MWNKIKYNKSSSRVLCNHQYSRGKAVAANHFPPTQSVIVTSFIRPAYAFVIHRGKYATPPYSFILFYFHVRCAGGISYIPGCLRVSHRRPPEMRGLRTRPRTDVDPPRFLDPWLATKRYATVELPSAGGISSRRPQGDNLLLLLMLLALLNRHNCNWNTTMHGQVDSFLQIDVSIITSCCSTDNDRPHRCYHLANKYGSRRIFRILFNGPRHAPKIAPPPLEVHLIHGFLAHRSPHRKRHLDWFIRFSTAHSCVHCSTVRHTDAQNTLHR